MLINAVLYYENKSNSIINEMIRKNSVVEPNFHKVDYMIKLYNKFPNMSSKDIFKKTFGRQQICVNYTLRNWVWTFSNESKTSTIYCKFRRRFVGNEF